MVVFVVVAHSRRCLYRQGHSRPGPAPSHHHQDFITGWRGNRVVAGERSDDNGNDRNDSQHYCRAEPPGRPVAALEVHRSASTLVLLPFFIVELP